MKHVNQPIARDRVPDRRVNLSAARAQAQDRCVSLHVVRTQAQNCRVNLPLMRSKLLLLCLLMTGVHQGVAQTAALLPLDTRPDEAAGLPGTDPAFTAFDGTAAADGDAGDAEAAAQRHDMPPNSSPSIVLPPLPPWSNLPSASASASTSTSASASASASPSAAPLAGLMPAYQGPPGGLPSRVSPGGTAPTRSRPRPLLVPLPAPDAPITVALSQVDLTAALQAFADFTGLNIVASDKVRGTVTLSLNQVPWHRAFDTLLEVNGLAMQQHGNVIWIAPASEIAAREKQRFEAGARISELEPLASRMFVLQYQRAEDIRKLLGGSGNQRVLSKRGTAMADPRTDHLFVTDLPSRLAQVAALIKSIDQPARQVLIESRIVEADESFSRNLGARLALVGGDPATAATSPHGIQGDPTGNVYDFSAGGIGGYAAATLGTTLFSAGESRKLMLQLSALEAQGHGRIVSSPRVVTADRVRALIEQGTELPYQAKVDRGMSAVQFRRAGLKLEVIPHITPDHHVMLSVDVTKDSVGAETTAGPAIDTKHVQTQVEVENGGTVAIGGIYIQDERRDTTGVPWLSHVPIIGFLFRERAVSHGKSELMIFITPTEVDPDAAVKVDAAAKPATPDNAAPVADGPDPQQQTAREPP
jgi:type IV pilus assembly protein PilQ